MMAFRSLFVPIITLVLSVSSLQLSLFAQTTFVWSSASGNWSNADNWNPVGVPGSNDHVIVDANNITIDVPVEVSGFTMTGGTVYADADLTVTGSMQWDAGRITGSATTLLTSTGSLSFQGIEPKEIYGGHSLVIEGSAGWSGTGDVNLENNATLVIASSGSLELLSDAVLDHEDPSGGTLFNYGQLSKTSGNGNSEIDVFLENFGTISISSGSVLATRGSGGTGGTIESDATSSLIFQSGDHLLDDVTVTSGNLVLEGNTTIVGDAGITVADAARIELSGAELAGAGNTTVNGTMVFSGGTIQTDGSLDIAGDLIISSTNPKQVTGSTLSLAGPGIWTDNGSIALGSSATFQIEEAAELEIQGSATLSGSSGQFVVLGTVDCSAIDSVTIDVDVQNSGLIEVSQGKTVLSRGGSHQTAELYAQNGAELVFGGGTPHLLSDVTTSGNGYIVFTAESVEISGQGLQTETGSFTTFDSELIHGDGPITIDGLLEWADGRITGSASFDVYGELQIKSELFKRLDDRNIVIHNNGSWSDAGTVFLKNNASITIGEQGSFIISGDAMMDYESPDGGVFINNGSLDKSGSPGLTTFDVTLINSGSIAVNSGIIEQVRGSEHTNATIQTSASSEFNFTFGTHLVESTSLLSGNSRIIDNFVTLSNSGLQISADATLRIEGGEVDGDGTLDVQGSMHWSAGTVSDLSSFLCSGELIFEGDATKQLSATTLISDGEAEWAGTGKITLLESATILNDAAGVFALNNSANMNGSTGTLENSGTLIKAIDAGTTDFDVTVVNSGTIAIESGSARFDRPLSNLSSGTISGNGNIDLNSTFTNDGRVAPGSSPGILTVDGTYSQSTDAKLEIEIGGEQVSSGYDRLVVDGTLVADGLLDIKRINNYKPLDESTYTILDYDGLNGEFPTVQGLTSGVHLSYALVYGDTSATLTANIFNTPPAVLDDLLQIDEDVAGTINIFLNDSDDDGDTLQVESFTLPEFGTLEQLDDSTFYYTPNQHVHGTDSFTYYALDTWGGFDSAVVSIEIMSINDLPISSIPPVVFDEDETTAIDLDDFVSDADHGAEELEWDAIVLDGSGDPENLIVSIDPATHEAMFSALPDSNGIFTVEFSVIDPEGGEYLDTVSVTVNSINDLPYRIGSIPNSEFPEDSGPHTIVADLYTIFADPDPQTDFVYEFISSDPGLLPSVNDHMLLIDSEANFFGVGELIIIADDGGGGTVSDTFSVGFTPINDAPDLVTLIESLVMFEDDTLYLDLDTLAIDVDDPPEELVWDVDVSSVDNRVSAEWDPATNTISFIPVENFNILDQPIYLTVCDTSNLCDQDTALFSVLPVNDLPIFEGLPDQLTFDGDTSAVLHLWDFLNDVESPDSAFTWAFTSSSDTLQTDFDGSNGHLTVSSLENVDGAYELTLEATDEDGGSAEAVIDIFVNFVVGIPGFGDGVPKTFALYQNYPNPFNPATTISYQLPTSSSVELSIFNMLGQRVWTVVRDNQAAGYHQIVWNGQNLSGRQVASGIYIYTMRADGHFFSRKLVLMR